MADVATRLRLERDWYLLLVAALIGALMSGVAIAFIWPLHWMQEVAEHVAETDPQLLWWLVPLLPAVGATLGGVVHFLIPTEKYRRHEVDSERLRLESGEAVA